MLFRSKEDRLDVGDELARIWGGYTLIGCPASMIVLRRLKVTFPEAEEVRALILAETGFTVHDVCISRVECPRMDADTVRGIRLKDSDQSSGNIPA